MSTIAVTERLQQLRALVKRLEEEHRKFASDIEGLDKESQRDQGVEVIRQLFVPLQDTLTEHMLVEEFEVYPELMRKNLFDSSISSIMQQHHDVSASLGKMELSLRLKNLSEFKAALEELAEVLNGHQASEQERVFPLATS